jgi:prepilin-type N-terminal cleavage/methylation domain-containing protein
MFLLTKKGFTLIELLIVVAIIGILAAIAVPNFLNAQVRANVAKAVANQKATSTALEMYRIDNNTYIPMYAYGGTFNNYYPYVGLTTPVAYLSSLDAVNNPFRNKEFTNTTSDNTYDQKFEYTPRKSGKGSSVPAQIDQNADMYLLEGVGPSQIDGIPGSPSYPGRPSGFAPYEMSNGLRSLGAIFITAGPAPDWIQANKAF